MQRRDMLGCLGTGAFAIAITGLDQAEADEPREHRGRGLPKNPRTACYEQCARVANLCLEVNKYVLASLIAAKGDGEALGKTHQALTECREFCELTSTIVLRDSPFTKEACWSCANVCSRCADLCERGVFEGKDQVVEELRECADICRKVAQG